MASKWNNLHSKELPFRLSVVDAWMMTDNRPESTSDGVHWIEENEKSSLVRPTVGEADGTTHLQTIINQDCILDRVWDDFIHGRTTT